MPSRSAQMRLFLTLKINKGLIMIYTTRNKARQTAQAINAMFPDLVKAPTAKTDKGWPVTFKKGKLSLKK